LTLHLGLPGGAAGAMDVLLVLLGSRPKLDPDKT